MLLGAGSYPRAVYWARGVSCGGCDESAFALEKKKEVVESPGSKLLLAGGCGLRVLATHSAKNRTQRGPTNLCVIDCRPSMEDSSSPDKFATCGLAHEVRPVARRLRAARAPRAVLVKKVVYVDMKALEEEAAVSS